MADIVGKSMTRSPSKEKEVRPSKQSMFDELRPVKIMISKDLVMGPDSLNVKRRKGSNQNSANSLSSKCLKHYVSNLTLNSTFL